MSTRNKLRSVNSIGESASSITTSDTMDPAVKNDEFVSFVRSALNSMNVKSTSDAGISKRQMDSFCVRLSFYRSVTVTHFGKYTKLCFDDQRSEHSFVADRSDNNLVDDGNNATSVMVLNRAMVKKRHSI